MRRRLDDCDGSFAGVAMSQLSSLVVEGRAGGKNKIWAAAAGRTVEEIQIIVAAAGIGE